MDLVDLQRNEQPFELALPNKILLLSKLIFIIIPSCDYPHLIYIYFLESKILEISCSIIIDYQFSDKRLPVLAQSNKIMINICDLFSIYNK